MTDLERVEASIKSFEEVVAKAHQELPKLISELRARKDPFKTNPLHLSQDHSISARQWKAIQRIRNALGTLNLNIEKLHEDRW